MRSKLHIYVLPILVALLGVSSCADDTIFDAPEIGEGESRVEGVVTFESFAPALQSRAFNGDIIKNIESLCIFAYDKNGTLVKKFTESYRDSINTDMPGDFDDEDKLVTDPGKPPHQAEGKTPQKKFSLKLPYGIYKLYAVANMGDLSGNQYISAEGDTLYKTEQGLKNITLTWDNTDIAKNNQMFGYFTLASDQKSQGFDAPAISITSPQISLHSWIKRAASKVTVAFDPSGLHEAVYIYIQKTTIHDIPSTCLLGADNKATEENVDTISPIQTIYYGEGATSNDHNKWLRIAKGTKGSGERALIGSDHSETAPAMFFYENMQGDFQDNPLYNKVMEDSIKFGNTPVRDPQQPDYKDAVRWGTYIEVEGYYESTNAGRVTKGPIKYRFMLGKNITYNYDAERNHHYKLTLKFRGYANEADWHIDYVDEKPAIYTPTKYFISYLYDEALGDGLPVRLVGNVKSLRAEIIENNWAPYDESIDTVPASDNPGKGDFFWNRQAYIDLKKEYDNQAQYRGNCNFVGFLSLRKTTEATISVPREEGDPNGYGPNTMTALKEYYTSKKRWYVGPVDDVPSTEPGYSVEPGTYPVGGNEEDGTYRVIQDTDSSVTVMVPMWTRAKSMAPMSGFTGNNPYDNYMRKAVVRFTAEFDSAGHTIEKRKDVPIFQVRRIVNPKGIWRSRDNDDKFDVVLTRLNKPTSTEFSEFKSEGKWRVTVEKGGEWVQITTLEDGSIKRNDTIFGSTDTPIKFEYKPSGTTTLDRCGIIKVEYHDYTCVHRIFVRQGYDDDLTLSSKSKTLWSCKNLYAFQSTSGSATTGSDEIATSNLNSINAYATANPLSIGSYFKRGSYDYGILEENNEDFGWNVSVSGKNLSTVYYDAHNNKQIRDAKWSSMWGVRNVYQDWTWAQNINVNKVNYRVPTYADFDALLKDTKGIGFGYGVVYADGATSTQLPVSDAFGFMDPNNNGGAPEMREKGVRCCVIYNNSNANQIILPLSASGYGRRACRPMAMNNKGKLDFFKDDRGKLIYAGVIALLKNSWASLNWYRPINYNLMRNPGATYWINAIKPGGHVSDGDYSAAWDFNYFNFDFGGYDSSTFGGNSAAASSDAMPIRLVR